MLETLKQCWTLAPLRHRRRWWVLAALSLVSAVLEVVAAVAMIVLMASLAGSALPRLPGGAALAIGTSALRSPEGLRWLCLWLAAVFALKYGVGTLIIVLQIRLPLAAGNEVIARLFQLYLSAPYEFHLRRNSAQTIRNLTSSIDVLYRIVAPYALALVSEAAAISAVMAVLLVSAPRETIVVGVIVAGSLLAFYRIFHNRLLVWGRRVQDLSRDGLMHARQSLDGIKDIRIAGAEGFFLQRFMDVRTALTETLVRQAQLQQIPKYLLEGCFVGFVLITVVVFSFRSDVGDVLPLLGLFAYSGLRILPSAGRMMVALQLIRSSVAAAAEVYSDFAELTARAREERAWTERPQHPSDAEIEIDRVTFRYGSGMDAALKDVSVKIRQGEVVAFVGLSGAGKSTLVNILLGLLEPQEGAIRFKGRDIRDDSRKWQSHIGYVPQSTFILDDSLCRNIAFGLPDEQIDRNRVLRALEQAQLSALTGGLADGLDARLGENGARLSGGERQRVAIARALYNDPAVVVFDEATSSVDSITEAQIAEVIKRMRRLRTVIIVTHKVRLTDMCDSIVLLHGGRVVGEGAFPDLYRAHAQFRALVDNAPREQAVSEFSEPSHG